VQLKSSLSSISLKLRAALLCISAYIPTARYLCRFKGHSAHHGCSRCLKEFPGGFGERDYSGLDWENWQPHCNRQHSLNARRIESCQTVTGRNILSQEFGITPMSHLLDVNIQISTVFALWTQCITYSWKLLSMPSNVGINRMLLRRKR